MVSWAVWGEASKVSSPSQVGCPSSHVVPGLGVTDATLSTETGTALAWMVTVDGESHRATIRGRSDGYARRRSRYLMGAPHVDPAVAVHVQAAPAASSGGSGSGSENVPEATALLPGFVTVTV